MFFFRKQVAICEKASSPRSGADEVALAFATYIFDYKSGDSFDVGAAQQKFAPVLKEARRNLREQMYLQTIQGATFAAVDKAKMADGQRAVFARASGDQLKMGALNYGMRLLSRDWKPASSNELRRESKHPFVDFLTRAAQEGRRLLTDPSADDLYEFSALMKAELLVDEVIREVGGYESGEIRTGKDMVFRDGSIFGRIYQKYQGFHAAALSE